MAHLLTEAFSSPERLNKPIDFSWATFTNGADFRDGTFVNNANFINATFINADFYRTTFTGWANFDKATFKDRTDFQQTTFTKKAYFSEANFIEKANFSFATFKKESDFYRAIFTKKAAFLRAIFMDITDFSGATFTGKAIFSGGSFISKAAFFGTKFLEEAAFSGARMEGRLVFRSINLLEEGGPSPTFQGVFDYLELSPEAVLRFQDLSLMQVKFEGSDLRWLEFHHVQWHPYPGRQAVYDEVLLRQEEKQSPWFWNGLLYDEPHAGPPSYWTDRYGEVERLYRDLQENYEKARDYKKMGDFHYGEMEMHRRANKWRWFPGYWYNLYWALSGYGERPSRALCCLVVLLAMLPLPIWLWGLDMPLHGNTPGLWETFTFIFEKATFQKPALLPGINGLGRFISNLALLFIPGQAALFLLALRNRLGRRR